MELTGHPELQVLQALTEHQELQVHLDLPAPLDPLELGEHPVLPEHQVQAERRAHLVLQVQPVRLELLDPLVLQA